MEASITKQEVANKPLKEALDKCYTKENITAALNKPKALAMEVKIADSSVGDCFVEYGNWETGAAQVNHEKCEIGDLKKSGDTMIIIIVVCVLLAFCIGACIATKCREKK